MIGVAGVCGVGMIQNGVAGVCGVGTIQND